MSNILIEDCGQESSEVLMRGFAIMEVVLKYSIKKISTLSSTLNK